MIELKGKYNTAKVFTDNIDSETIGQIVTLLNQESVKGSQIRIMPDTHAGKGCVIGTTMTIADKVIPNLVGVDIGCFTGDTEVFVAGGAWVEIKKLVDRGIFTVDSYDMETKQFVTSKAIAKKTRENAQLVRVEYHSVSIFGQKTFEVYCTPDHNFLVRIDEHEEHWVEAKDLSCGDELVSEDHKIIVEGVYSTDRVEDVYCLTVEDTHTFLIDGSVVVHNCGMTAVKLQEDSIDLPALDNVIRRYVPSGAKVNSAEKPMQTTLNARDLRCYEGAGINDGLAYRSVGTLGGGNHFIEVDRDSEGNLWLVVHTGSRNLGLEVCNYYQDLAYSKLCDVPQALAYLEGNDLEDYLHDMDLVQKHAVCNRAEIVRLILTFAELHEVERFETIHNYIDVNNRILRKGSVSAQAGEKLIIPINMRDGSLICVGKGNPDWNYSAPHGAGRLMSRVKAKESISLAEFKKTMADAGIYSTSVKKNTIDESPMAYKPIQEIIDNVQDTVEILDIIKPIYNFKAN